MPDAPAGPAPEAIYEVEFERFTGTVLNPDFKGPGQLRIRPGGPTYVFSGRPKGLIAPKSGRLVFGPTDITDVQVTGRRISFTTHLGMAGRKNQPFGFSCRDEAEAQAIAAQLPKLLSRDASASRDFMQRLDAVAPAGPPWRSVTMILIALNLAVFVAMGALGAGWLRTTSMLPYVLYGANNGAATTDGQWWRLLASLFMHYGVVHLLLNMWALFAGGGFLERLLGRSLFLLTYLASGLAGGFASILWHGDRAWSAGASGAVFGVFGAVAGCMLRERKGIPAPVFQSLLRNSLGFACYNLLFGLTSRGIDNAAHLGGAAAGLVLGWLLALSLEPATRARQLKPRLALGCAAAALLVGAGVALTPRFDYRVADEFAWARTNRPFLNREDTLIQENEVALRQLARGKPDAGYPDWLESQLIPFYEDWIKAMEALSLAPGMTTARRQAESLAIFRMRVESYRRLAAGLRNGDRNAASEFFVENARASEAIIKMHRTYDR